MPSPFPGMDPYLESPEIWPDVHHALVSEIRATLNKLLRPSRFARVELRVYASKKDDPGRAVLEPDLYSEEIETAYIAIKQVGSESLVSIIEILSPSEKIRSASVRTSLMERRAEIGNSDVHWVEIDLLRSGVPTMPRPSTVQCDYSVLVSCSSQRPNVRYWPIGIRQALPVIGIPLRGNEPDVPLDLGTVLTAAYDRAAYDRSLDYTKEPKPALESADARWARELLRGKR